MTSGNVLRFARSRRLNPGRQRAANLTGAPASLDVRELAIPAVKLIVPPIFPDARGWFSEVYSSAGLACFGIEHVFVQDNVSLSRRRGTIRGLHFQKPPHAQAKLVRVLRGSILDVAVDLRRRSATFGAHVCAELSRENRAQLLIPEGFAHGFCVLEPDTEVLYKVSRPFAPEAERGLCWHDPDLAIRWPVDSNAIVISAKDAALPRLRNLDDDF